MTRFERVTRRTLTSDGDEGALVIPDGLRFVALDPSPEVDEYASLGEMRMDLKAANTYLDELDALREDATDRADTLGAAVFLAAMMAYARCFANAPRPRLLATDLSLAPNQLLTHAGVMALRDKHYAHPVSQAGGSEVYAQLVDGEPRRVVGLGYITSGPSAPDGTSVTNFRALVARVGGHVRARMRELRPEVMAGLPDLDDLYARPDFDPKYTNPIAGANVNRRQPMPRDSGPAAT